MKPEENNSGQQPKENKGGLKRRDLIKGLATVPVLGAFWYSSFKKKQYDGAMRSAIMDELQVKAVPPPPSGSMKGDPIRLGIIGYGIRGKQLMKAAGFAPKDWLAETKAAGERNRKDRRYADFAEQENLNVVVNGVCDVFDVRAEEAMAATDNPNVKRYRYFEEMLASPDIDAVIIATPDHWHAPMAIAAAQAGKHVYVEKCMTHNIPETFDLYNTVQNSGVVFQVGHQHRQTETFLTAQDIINKNVLGHISLIQTNTNRNSDNGAWQYDIHEKASPQTIDWQQFLGNAPEIPFDAERFFRWRKWWDYGTGLSGDLLTHEFDSINTILKMGIPASVTASGGVYTHVDGREVPDVFQVVMEYPERKMAFMYTATLGNQFHRQNMIMGHDASMELGATLNVYPDARSSRYGDMLKSGLVTPDMPMYAYSPGARNVDGFTSATAKYFAGKGLLYTYRNGRRVDSTHLHIREWLSCIRHGGQPSCSIEEGFEEAIAAHMATISYKEGRRVHWDAKSRSIITPETPESIEIEGIKA